MSVFNENINPLISGSLVIRQELMGTKNRTPQQLSFLNSNTSWVSLKSAIDVDGKPDLAKSNVLEGGSLFFGKQRHGVGINSSNAYSLKNTLGENNILGIRPMPGITSVTVENIGAYGSTRKATINYQCWDVKQLDILEQLYMRPGYLVLLEFGRTTYLDEKGNLKPVEHNYDFFEQKNINLLEELNKLYKLSFNSKGNYDAFLGYVVNYGWQVRDDGGYDCKTEIISTGEIVESLKTNYSLATNVSFGDIETSNPKFQGLLIPQLKPKYPNINLNTDDIKLINQDYSTNILAGLIRELYLIGQNSITPTEITKYPITLNNETFDIDIVSAYYSSEADGNYKLLNTSNANIYITLNSLVELINNIIIPHSTNNRGSNLGALTKLSVKGRKYLGKENELLKCLFNIFMASVDPDVCLIKNPYWTTVLQNININVNVDPIQPIPPGNPDLQDIKAINLQKKIANWLIQIAENKVKSNIIDNIFEDKKGWKGTEDEYFKYFQKNYQIVRGGLNPETTVQSSTNLVLGQGGGTTVNYSEPKAATRSWNYIKGNSNKTPEEIKNIRNKLRSIPVGKDTYFIGMLRSADLQGGGDERDKVIRGLRNSVNNNFNNTALDNQLNTQQLTANKGIETAKKIEEEKTIIKELGKNYQAFLDHIPEPFTTSDDPTALKHGQIGNIYVNLKYLYKLADDANLKTQDPNEKSYISLSQFIKTMIKDIQASIGNVNNFELFIDDSIGRIVDLNYINLNKDEEVFQFEIGSNKSIIRNLQLESKVFSDQMSMIAISAQGNSGRLGLDNSTLVAFNKGVTDRLIPHKDSPFVINQDDTISSLVSSLSGIIHGYFKPFISEYFNQNGKYNANSSTSYKDYLRDIIVFFTNELETDNKNSMLLPVRISFTLDGISGLVIGNLFRVDQTFIPKSYKNNDLQKYGFSIVKVGHNIQNNDWVTNIEGNQFPLNINPKITSPPTSYFNLIVNYNPNTGGSTIALNSSSPITSNQQNVNILKIYNSLKNWYGLSPEQAAGIIGNSFAESSLNPSSKTTDTNRLPSAGLFQWNGDRYNKLINKYPNWQTNIDSQLNYLKSELDSNFKSVINNIKSTTGTSKSVVENSNYIWASEFEKCVECKKGRNTEEIAKRLRFSLKALEVIQHPEKYIK